MIYCFKKLRELRLTHIFFLHYSISLLIGGAAIAGLILLGGGLQFYSVVVLCIMYYVYTANFLYSQAHKDV